MHPDEAADLIHRAQAGDPAAFDVMVDDYGPRLYGYLYRLVGSRHDAEDLLQELFVRVVKTIGRYEHDGRFEGWLFRIATNLVRDRVRRQTSTLPAKVSDADGEYLSGVPADRELSDPSCRLVLTEEVDRLQRALGRLSEAEREVVMLRHFSGLSFREIADLMGTPLGTALARAHRGLQHLRQLMGDEAAGLAD